MNNTLNISHKILDSKARKTSNPDNKSVSDHITDGNGIATPHDVFVKARAQ